MYEEPLKLSLGKHQLRYHPYRDSENTYRYRCRYLASEVFGIELQKLRSSCCS